MGAVLFISLAREMKDILVREFQVTRVVLFGSVLVKGQFTGDSKSKYDIIWPNC